MSINPTINYLEKEIKKYEKNVKALKKIRGKIEGGLGYDDVNKKIDKVAESILKGINTTTAYNKSGINDLCNDIASSKEASLPYDDSNINNCYFNLIYEENRCDGLIENLNEQLESAREESKSIFSFGFSGGGSAR